MRAKVLILTGLLIAASFAYGCAVDMSSKGKQEPGKAIKGPSKEVEIEIEKFTPVVTVTTSDTERALALIKHDDGYYYIIDMKRATAKKVSGIGP